MSDSDEETPPKKKTKSVTPDLPSCPYGVDCYRKNPKHFEEFSHPDKDNKALGTQEPVAGPSSKTTEDEPLSKCPYGSHCYRKNPVHFKEYSHDASSDSDTDNYYSGDEAKDKSSSSVLVKKLSQLTPEEQKELLKTAVEAKEQLEQQLEQTKSDKTKKEEELKNLLSRMNKETLMMEGEKEALEKPDSGVVYFDLLPERLYNEGSAAQFHMRLAESQFYRLVQRMGHAPYQVKNVQYVVNPKLVWQFKKSKEEMGKNHGDVHTVLAFHGTKEKDIQSICEKGFRVSDHAAGDYGQGVHFSEYPRSSIQYFSGTNKLLLCQILPGKVYTCEEEMPDAELEKGYDSHSSLDGKEIVIFHQERILPCYIVHYKKSVAEFVYKNASGLTQKPKDKAELQKLYQKAQRTRKAIVLAGKHIRLCGKLAEDHGTIGRLIRKHCGFYVDDEPPYSLWTT